MKGCLEYKIFFFHFKFNFVSLKKIILNGDKTMETIRKQYIIDEQNEKIAVQLPIKTFEKIEEILENYALFQLMKENEGEETLNINKAKSYYNKLEKAQ